MRYFDTAQQAIKKFWTHNSGSTPVEYGFIALVVSTAVIAGATTIGTSDAVTLSAIKELWVN